MDSRRQIEKRARVQWAAWWPLILYFFLTFAIGAVVFSFVNQKNFSTTSRRPSVPQADGSVASMRYTPLQSDVTTLLSLSLGVLRVVGALSLTRITWRCVYFLMGKGEGVSLEDIKRMLGTGLPTRSWGTQRAAHALVAAILLTAFPSQFSSPILTGSISWDASTYSVQGVKPATGIPLATPGVAWTNYHNNIGFVNVVIQQAVGLAGVAWGNTDSTNKSMVRVLPMFQNLPIGSELVNVTVPYFAIDGVEWAQAADVTFAQLELLYNCRSKFMHFEVDGPSFALIPDSQCNLGGDILTFPHPSIQSETRILVVAVDSLPPNATCTHTTGYFGKISPKIELQPINHSPSSTVCLAFARVTYHAGAAVCHRCRLSNHFIFSNTTVVELQEDVMTTPALALMSTVSEAMLFANFSLPSPINNLDNFITDGLSRSYQASWNALHAKFGQPSTSLSTDIMISVPSTRANVQKGRILVWVAFNILFTLSGLLCFSIREPLVIDVMIAAMFLETDKTIRTHKRKFGDLSIVEKEDRNLRLRLEYDNEHRILTATDSSSDESSQPSAGVGLLSGRTTP